MCGEPPLCDHESRDAGQADMGNEKPASACAAVSWPLLLDRRPWTVLDVNSGPWWTCAAQAQPSRQDTRHSSWLPGRNSTGHDEKLFIFGCPMPNMKQRWLYAC